MRYPKTQVHANQTKKEKQGTLTDFIKKKKPREDFSSRGFSQI
jgi:hypothetical protein